MTRRPGLLTELESIVTIKIVKVKNTDPDLIALVRQLDADLNARYGQLQGQYNAYNSLQSLDAAFVLYADENPAACGAYKRHDDRTAEIKRVFVDPHFRDKGFARKMMAALEQSAAQNGYHTCVLETGVKQNEAISLYHTSGYKIIPNYGQYAGNGNSVCMKKRIER